MYHILSNYVERLTKITAIAGGISLLAVIILTCLSVSGRALDGVGLGPIPGDLELVELGIGFAVFAALPYAQFSRAHASVDIFKTAFGPMLNRVLDALGELFMMGFAGLVLWRLYLGMLDKASYNETTFILQIPVAWGYRAALIAVAVMVITAAFCLLRSLRAMFYPNAPDHPATGATS